MGDYNFDLRPFFVLLFILGSVVGSGLYEGCRYIIKHVHVTVTP